ncbi:MAG TPA: aldehyde dehydrogenase family protein, partial [Longimicrobium sp.]
MPHDPGRWIERATALRADGRALLGGHRTAAASGESFPLTSPRDGGKLADVAACGEHDVERAVALARRGADAGSWSRQPAKHRQRVLARWADLLEGAREDLALLLALETGKPIRTALTVEMRSVVQSIRWYAEIADKLEGRHPQAGPHAVALVEREPAGVVGVVLPWNFPLSMVGYDLAPALAIGNSVVVKPSELAPLSVLRACELAVEAGVPPDVLAVLPGSGPVAGGALGRHHDVDVITVTGAPATGRAFLEYSARSNGKRVWPKLGGKSAVIICRDAP